MASRAPLMPRPFSPLPPGAVQPLGWLDRQCRIQANGITGHIEEFWPDLGPDNMWLGGESEGWERAPYYLDGLVALAHVLDDSRLKAMALRWIDSILGMVHETGWIGPIQAPYRKPWDQWPVAIVLKALTQHYDATLDPRALCAVTEFCRYLRDTLAERPLFDWGRFRWPDLVLSVHWLYDRTGEPWLLDVAEALHSQGYDWREHFEQFRYRCKTALEDCTLETHVVNSAMAVKSGGVRYRQTGDPADRASVFRTLEALDRYHGQSTGVFTGDEHYAGTDPAQGTELCAVVEYLFSLEELIPILGEPTLADRLERIAYNALPAAFTPDMWSHQYDQQANQVLCTVAPRQWTNNDPASNIYGLEPNFGCCTANLHQGWPKFVRGLWMAGADGGLAAVAYGPSLVIANVAGGATVTVREETDYPFRGTIRFTVECAGTVRFPLTVRVPEWAGTAAVTVGGEASRIVTGPSWHTIDREWRAGDGVTVDLEMRARVAPRPRGAVAVHRGPLVFGLAIGERFEPLAAHGPVTDWAVHPTSPWNYALAIDPNDAECAFSVQEEPVGAVPFSPNTPPVVLRVDARRLTEWTLSKNSAGPLPDSPADSAEPVESVELIPYGSGSLRISEFPVTR